MMRENMSFELVRLDLEKQKVGIKSTLEETWF